MTTTSTEPRLLADLYAELVDRARDLALARAATLGFIPGFRIGECADGSRRYYAAVGADEEHLIYTPAPAEAPGWARRFTDWTTREER